ncbi:MAG: redoxin domain-containing protein [Candidatus Acidiferrum sp.]
MELEALQAALPDIQRLGANLIAISPQLEKYGRIVHRRLNLSFDILADHGLQVASQFGLVFTLPDYLKTLYVSFGSKLDEFNGEDAFRLPMPARYVLDQQSVIRAADVNPDYTIRPDPGETVRVLEQLRSKC